MKVILSIIVLLALASLTVGGTFAGFSDTDLAVDNSLTTGSLDLKVGRYVEDYNCGLPTELVFYDDEPWGYGLPNCFFIMEITNGQPYDCDLVLWNAGTTDGMASLHLKIFHDPENYAAGLTVVTIWFDGVEIASGTLAELACSFITLGMLHGEEQLPLHIQVIPYWDHGQSHELIFDTLFSLVDLCPAYSDTEECRSFLDPNPGDLGGTPGFWRNPGSLQLYDKEQMAEWFRSIVLNSVWFEDGLASLNDEIAYNNMVGILGNVGGGGYDGMVNKFRAQYLATWLNVKSGRLGADITHDISSIPNAVAYLGSGTNPLTLSQILTAIESKASGDIFTSPPYHNKMELMKDVCDGLNNIDF